MTDNVEIIRRFLDAWPRLDPKGLASYFAEDGVYYNMPMAPVAGRDNVEQLIRDFTSTWSETEWKVLNLFGAGEVVVAERLDCTRAGDKSVELPCTGIFEMKGGKIKVWRDYFDLGTYTQAMS